MIERDEDNITYQALSLDASETNIGPLDLESFVHPTHGRILELDTGGGFVAELGTFSVIQVDVESAIAAGESVFAIFDISQTTMDYFEALYAHGWDFKASVYRAADPSWTIENVNLLIIDRLVIRPAYRGIGLGLDAMTAIIQRFRMGAGLVAIKPFPLQLEGAGRSKAERMAKIQEYGLERWGSIPERIAFANLRKLYARLDFVRVPRTAFMVRLPNKPFSREFGADAP